jgi:hypothetical protein
MFAGMALHAILAHKGPRMRPFLLQGPAHAVKLSPHPAMTGAGQTQSPSASCLMSRRKKLHQTTATGPGTSARQSLWHAPQPHSADTTRTGFRTSALAIAPQIFTLCKRLRTLPALQQHERIQSRHLIVNHYQSEQII